MRKEYTKNCVNCGKKFIFKAGSKKELAYRKFCSTTCNGNYYAEKLSRERMGDGNPMFGKKPWNYKGIKKIKIFGKEKRVSKCEIIGVSGSRKIKYKIIYIGKKQVRYHRWLMEKKIGRPLKSSELVHHKDGNGLNNDYNNLMIITHAEHQRLHNCYDNLKGGGANVRD
jgi:hypothetical protein